jgi:putative phage-type endonuclease
MDYAKWLEERRKGIGGSDVAAILGLSPFKTAFQVYQEKRKEVEDWQGNESTDWGKRLEPAIRQWYSDTTGRSVRLPDKIIYNEKHPFMLASIDGFTDDSRGVEIKTARSGKGWGEPGTNEIPDYYAVQCHHYMIVTGFPVFDVPVSIMGDHPKLYEVPADKEIHEMIIDAEANFWQRVVDGNPPDPVTYADAVARFGKAKSEGVVVADDKIISLVNDLKDSRNMVKTHEDYEEDIKTQIIIALGERGDTLIDSFGNTILTYKLSNGRKSFDGKRFKKEHPDLYQQYLKTSEPSRRFLLK